MIIKYDLFNSIDSSPIMTVTIPWNYKKACLGYYSNMWKGLRLSCASSSKIDKQFVRGNVSRSKQRSDRMEIILPSGLRFNAPFEMSKIDFKIINLHLEALQLSISN